MALTSGNSTVNHAPDSRSVRELLGGILAVLSASRVLAVLSASRVLAVLSASRTLWFVMLAMHVVTVPGLIVTISKTTQFAEMIGPLLRVVGLSASAAFFVLKIIDLPCLRINRGWRSMVAVVLVIGLLHVGVIDRSIGGDVATESFQLGFIALVGAVRCRAAILHALRRIRHPLLPIRRIFRNHPHCRFDGGLAWTWTDDVLCRLSQILRTTFAGPRAPPTS